jgi:DNA ligase-1
LRRFVVWEMKGAEFTLSPIHRAAVGRIDGTSRGLSVRFPRFIRVREDKPYTDATSVDQLIELYDAQVDRCQGRGDGSAAAAASARRSDDEDDD